jgi:hypothetical protein
LATNKEDLKLNYIGEEKACDKKGVENVFHSYIENDCKVL